MESSSDHEAEEKQEKYGGGLAHREHNRDHVAAHLLDLQEIRGKNCPANEDEAGECGRIIFEEVPVLLWISGDVQVPPESDEPHRDIDRINFRANHQAIPGGRMLHEGSPEVEKPQPSTCIRLGDEDALNEEFGKEVEGHQDCQTNKSHDDPGVASPSLPASMAHEHQHHNIRYVFESMQSSDVPSPVACQLQHSSPHGCDEAIAKGSRVD
mmetsp:Transcript_7861/g.18790  ORF Transcript_7861/g.18790 Transcript_7861/m.18790 type:complete len:211 (+) Transcript_7861:704-1336(+)